jgi:hypothetical protein
MKNADLSRSFKQQFDHAGQMDHVDPSIAEVIVDSGLMDGNTRDDKVAVSKKTWAASSLKPSQQTMVLGKSLGMAIAMLRSGKIGGDLAAIVSSDNYIMDGHHRWSATILASGSKGKVGGFGASLKGADLLKVLNMVSKGMFKVRNGKPGKGSLASYTPDKVRAALEEALEKGFPGEFPIPPEVVAEVLAESFGSAEAGVDKMSANADLITKTTPSWAPDRAQMPVIEPGEVPAAAHALAEGKIDWNYPYRKEAAMDRQVLIRLASRLPQGSEERRAILSGLQKAAGRKWGPLMFEESGQHGHKLVMSMIGDPEGGGVIDGQGEVQFANNEEFLEFLQRLRRFCDSGISILQRG